MKADGELPSAFLSHLKDRAAEFWEHPTFCIIESLGNA